jgi:hypothetical protein
VSELAGGDLTEGELAERAEVGEVAGDVDGEGERERERARVRERQ